MEDFGVKESVVVMFLVKEAKQAQAVYSTLCAQSALLLGSRLPLILNATGWFF